MLRLLATVVVAAMVMGSLSAQAVNLPLQAGTRAVPRCDADGVQASYATSFSGTEHRVTGVTVSGFADACLGLRVTIVLTGADGAVLSTVGGPVLGGGSTGLLFLRLPARSSELTRFHAVVSEAAATVPAPPPLAIFGTE